MKNLYWVNYLKRVTWTVCRFKGAQQKSGGGGAVVFFGGVYTPMHTMTYYEEQTK